MDWATLAVAIASAVVSIVAIVVAFYGVRYQRQTHRDTTRRAKETTVAVYYTLEGIMRRVSHTPMLGDEYGASCETYVLPDPFPAAGRSVELKLRWRFEEHSVVEVNCTVVSPSGSVSTVPVANARTITLRYPEDFSAASTAELGRYEVQWHGSGPEVEDVVLGITSFLVGPFG
jgi:hypothetical protein